MKVQQHTEQMTVHYKNESEMNHHCKEMLQNGYRVHLNGEWKGKWKAYFVKDHVAADWNYNIKEEI